MLELEDFNDVTPGDLLLCRPTGLAYFCVGLAEEGRPILVAAIVPGEGSASQWNLVGSPPKEEAKMDSVPPDKC